MVIFKIKTLQGKTYRVQQDDSGQHKVIETDSIIGKAFVGLNCEPPVLGWGLQVHNGGGGHTSAVISIETEE